MKRRIRIAITEDHNVVRQGMLALFDDREDIKVVFDAANGVELLDHLKEEKPDVILLDLNMPVMSGEEALKIIKTKYPFIKVIIVSMHSGLEYIRHSIANGAHGFLQKEADFDKIIDAIYAVFEKGYYFDDMVTQELVSAIKKDEEPIVEELAEPLTSKDVLILQMICEGKTNRQISEQIHISIRTVEGRRLNLSKKIGAKNVGDLVVYAIKHGIFKIE